MQDECKIEMDSGPSLMSQEDTNAVIDDWDSKSYEISKLNELKHESGVWLSWENLVVEVSVSKGFCKGGEKKTIIHGSRGKSRPGELLSVMGPSGAGKTSLFNSLAKRGQGYEVSGTLLLNNLPYDKDDLKQVAGFVFQSSVMHTHLKVIETLRIAAKLKLPRTMSAEDKEQRVQVLLDAFDLRKCEQTKVGDSKVKGISGGEKKRLSIAIEVLTGPSLLFLDEPTTGLDAASSLSLVKLLRQLADAGTNVVMVLHQPRAQILKYIDQFLVLSDGRDVYYGDLPNMLKFFERIELPIPLRVNPLDYVLDIINTNELLEEEDPANENVDSSKSFAQLLRGDMSQQTFPDIKKRSMGDSDVGNLHLGDRKQLALKLSAKYRESGLFEELSESDPKVMPPLQFSAQTGSSFSIRFRALLQREFIQKIRNPEVTVTEIFGAIVLSCIMGSVYYQMPPFQTFNITAAVSFGTLMCLFLVFHLILTFPVERNIWLRDRDNGLYRSGEYYLAIVLAGIPGDLVASGILATILYWMFGLRASADAYFIWLGFFFLIIQTGASLMYLGGAISPSPSLANSFVSVILLFVMVFNGFFIVYSTIPVWYRWIADINFMRFAISVLYYNQFAGQVFNCTVGVTENCFYSTGDEALVNLGVPVDLQVWNNAVYILIIMFIMHFFAFLAVTFCFTNAHKEIAKSCSEKCGKKKKKEIEMN